MKVGLVSYSPRDSHNSAATIITMCLQKFTELIYLVELQSSADKRINPRDTDVVSFI